MTDSSLYCVELHCHMLCAAKRQKLSKDVNTDANAAAANDDDDDDDDDDESSSQKPGLSDVIGVYCIVLCATV